MWRARAGEAAVICERRWWWSMKSGICPSAREECHLFYRFVAARYEKASTVITSNKAFGDWAELFHDPVIVTAILDRLLHHSVVINIRGHSYRLKGKLGAWPRRKRHVTLRTASSAAGSMRKSLRNASGGAS